MMRLWYISLIQEAFHFVISLKNPVIRLVVSSYLYKHENNDSNEDGSESNDDDDFNIINELYFCDIYDNSSVSS